MKDVKEGGSKEGRVKRKWELGNGQRWELGVGQRWEGCGYKGGREGGSKGESKAVSEKARVGVKGRDCKGESKKLNPVRSTFGTP